MTHTIELDAKKWKTVPDFYEALLPALGAPEWHGRNLNALIDSMVWGGINAVEPPYTIRILRTAGLPKDIRDEIEILKRDIAAAGAEFHDRNGRDVEIRIEADF